MNAVEGKFVNVLGEYGGIGYPVEGHLWLQDRNWGYGEVMHNQKDLMDRYEEFAELLKHYVHCGTAADEYVKFGNELLKYIKQGFTAAVYTQTTDVEIEVNGIMTYDRIVKVDEPRFREINRSVIELEVK